MTVRFLGGVAERRRRFAFGPAPTFKQDFVTGGGGALPQGATFSRGTIGTLYNQSGLVAYAPSNLLTYSEQFNNAAWSQTGIDAFGSGSVANAITAPDGTLAADFLRPGTASSAQRTFQTTTVLTGFSYTQSYYVKSGGYSKIAIRESSATGYYVSFDVSTNSILASSSATGTITNVGNGWFRCTAYITATSTSWASSLYVLPASYTTGDPTIAWSGDGVSGAYVWGAQLEQGSNVTTYTPTTTAAVYGPRFDYDPNNVLQQNLITNSQTFNASPASWAFSNIALSSNVAQAPDGTNTASLITTSLVGSAALMNGTGAALSIIPTPNTVVTRSFYLKYSFGNGLFYSEAEGGASGDGIFDLVNISASASLGSATITAVGNGWYRCSHTYTTAASPSSTTRAFYLQALGSSTAAAGLFIWGFQFNYGSTALPYLATTSTTQAVCAPRGLLIEEARTNLLTYSQDITNAVWLMLGTAGGSRGADETTAPDGTFTADRFSVGTGSGYWYIANYANLSIVSGQAYTFSAYVKANGLGFVFVRAHNNSGNLSASGFIVSLSDGSVTYPSTPLAPACTATVTNAGNGWWKISATSTANLTVAGGAGGPGLWPCPSTSFALANGSSPANFTGDGVSGIYIWGAQFETGTFATSYIPTTSATVTRNFDNLSITSTNFASWFNQTTGTFAVQYDVGGSYAGSPTAFTANPSCGFNTGSVNAQWWNGSTNIFTANSVSTLNTTRKEAMAYAASSRALCLNGGAVASDANVPFSGALTGMYFGSAYGGGTQNINGHIRSFSYYNYTLTNAQLQQVTT